MPGKIVALQTEYEFTLPKGYLDGEGVLHREGCMRLSTAIDEIAPLRDPRVRGNEAYLTIAILARVITRLGKLPAVDTDVVEKLFTADLAYLQDFYRQINADNSSAGRTVTCPECQHKFEIEAREPGGS